MEVVEYPYAKAVLLNAVYDVLERLAIPIVFADSRAGVIRYDGGEMSLAAILRDDGVVTRVEIKNTAEALRAVLLDELRASLEECFEMKRRTAV